MARSGGGAYRVAFGVAEGVSVFEPYRAIARQYGVMWPPGGAELTCFDT